MRFIFARQPDNNVQENAEVVSQPPEESKGVRDTDTLEQRIEVFVNRMNYKNSERWGYLSEIERAAPMRKMLNDIKDALNKEFGLSENEVIGVDSPEINAFVIKNRSDVYIYMGLLNAMYLWCEKKKKPFTRDKIAFILAHEMAHIEQGTEEQPLEDEKEGTRNRRQESKNLEYDADRLAIVRMAHAGFNPREGLEAMYFLQSLGDGIPYFSSHPRSLDRLRELEDYVYDVDGFLPSVSKKPASVSKEVIDLVKRETIAHPGTEVYRNEAMDTLPEMARAAQRFYDVFEVVAIAREHDFNILAAQEAKKDFARVNLAKRLILDNLSKYFTKITESYALGSSFDSDVTKSSRYIDNEFDYEDKFKSQSQSVVELAEIEKRREEPIEKSIKKIQKMIKEGKSKLEDRIAGLSSMLEGVKNGDIEENCSESDYSSLAELEEKLNVSIQKLKVCGDCEANDFALIKDSLSGVTVQTLDDMVRDTVIDRKYRLDEKVMQMDAAGVLDWSSSQASSYFSGVSRDRLNELETKSKGIVHFESRYEPYLPVEYGEKEELETPESRELYVKKLLFTLAKRDVENDYIVSLQMKVNPDIERIPFCDAMPQGTFLLDSVLPVLIERFEDRYRDLGLNNVGLLSEFIAKITFDFANVGYDPAELKEIVAGLDIEECRALFAGLPLPGIEITSSGNSLFNNESNFGVRQLGMIQLMYMWERELVTCIKDRLTDENPDEEISSTADRIEKIRLLFERSDEDEVALYFKELVGLFVESDVSTCSELVGLTGPFLSLLGVSYMRRSLFREVVEAYKVKMPYSELMLYHEGEHKREIYDFFKSVWKEEKDRNRMSDAEKLVFIKACFVVIPESRPDSSGWSSGYDDGFNAAEFDELAVEFMRLNTELYPDQSPVEAIKFLLKEGALEFGSESLLAGDEDLTDLYNGLSKDEILELAEFVSSLSNEKRSDPFFAVTKLITSIECAALTYLNGGTPKAYNELHKPYAVKFDKSIPIVTNLEYILKYAAYHNDAFLLECLSGYDIDMEHATTFDSWNLPPAAQEGLRNLIETSDENPNAFWPTGAIHLFSPLSSSSNFGYVDFPNDIDESAGRYDPNNETSFIDKFITKRDFSGKKIGILKRYFTMTGLLSGVPVESGPYEYISDVKEAIANIVDSPLDIQSEFISSLMDRAKKLVSIIPEDTNFRDDLFEQMESSALAALGLEIEGDKVKLKEGAKVDNEGMAVQFDFYKFIIPYLVDLDTQQLWSRKVDQFYNDYLSSDNDSFESELKRIEQTYPSASYARDEALLRIGDLDFVQEPYQSKAIMELLFENQKRSRVGVEVKQQKSIELFNEIIAKLSRVEKKDFILWIIGANDSPPLLLRAVGGENNCSFETLPEYIFGATVQERQELLIRLLYGENGVMDPRSPEDERIFEKLLASTFERIFPSNDPTLSGKGREVVRSVFETVFHKYPPLRRAKIFVSMIESMRSGSEDSSMAERVRALVEQLGPVFIKAGQILSEEESEPGVPLLSKEIQEEMRKLKQDVRSFHRTGAFQILEGVGEFDEGKADRLLCLDKKLGSASIKVVYNAVDAQGNEQVVKIRRPSIGKHLNEDMRVLSEVLASLSGIEGVSLPENIDRTIKEWMREESDFSLEVKNHKAVGAVLDNYEKQREGGPVPNMAVRVPEVFSYSTEHIRERNVKGLSLEDLLNVQRGNILLDDVLKDRFEDVDSVRSAYEGYVKDVNGIKMLAFDCLMYQIFKEGDFHADVHAGNMIITPNDELFFIDLGSGGEIKGAEQEAVRQFFHAFIFSKPELEGMRPPGMDLSHMIRESVNNLIQHSDDADSITEVKGKVDAIEGIVMSSDLGNKAKFQRIMEVLSSGEHQAYPGFDKFVKAMAVGNYLIQGQELEALQSIVKHAPVV